MDQKLSPTTLANKNGAKKVKDKGIAINIFLEKVIVFSKSLYSKYENKMVIMLTNGKATMKPARVGFLKDNQLAKEITKLAKITFKKKIST